MWEWGLYGLAIYGAVTLWVQLLRRWSWWADRNGRPLHFIILLHNSQGKVEWIYRSLMQMSRLTGEPVSFTFIDFGSSDDTLRILRRLTRGKYQVQIQQRRLLPDEPFPLAELLASEERAICIDLRMEAMENTPSAAS